MKPVAIIGDFLRQPRPLVEDIVRAVVNVALPLTELQDAATRIILDVIDPRTIKRPDRITPSNPEGYVTVGLNKASGRGQILMELKSVRYVSNEHEKDTIKDLSSEERINLMIDTAEKVSRGAGAFIRMNADPLQVDAFPALALYRDHQRAVPRGFKAGPKGTLIELPEDNWPSRWADAGATSTDTDWLPWEGDGRTGRGVALKSSDIWNQLGDVLDDSLGNSFPPFAFNSGFGVYEVDYKEAVELGLLAKNAKAKPAKLLAANEIAERLAKKFHQYIAKLESEEQNRRNKPTE
jgi:hypothetical protein